MSYLPLVAKIFEFSSGVKPLLQIGSAFSHVRSFVIRIPDCQFPSTPGILASLGCYTIVEDALFPREFTGVGLASPEIDRGI